MKFLLTAAALLLSTTTDACTNILVTKGASTEETNMIAYNADSASLFGALYHYPESHNNQGKMRDIYEWDTGKFLGQIPEAKHTHNVVGNTNGVGLTIGETTFGGIESLCHQPDAKIDYGSLIYLTLQRASSAREAIKVMDELMQRHGYFSEGESFSLSDKDEVWIMEVIGKGEKELGSVWVACR